MTCAEALERLDDDVDGALSEAEFQELELHLAGCAECRREERALRALLAEAAALPRELSPARDLWPGIADRIAALPAAGPPAPRAGAWRWSGLAAAAALVAALSAPLVQRPRPTPDGSPAMPPPTALRASYGASGAPLAAAEAEYVRASRELMLALDARRPALSPETLRVVDANLRLIDDALEQIHGALVKDPASAALARLLSTTYQRKIELLRRVTKLKA